MGLIDKLKRTFVAPIVEEKEEGAAMVRSLRETGAAALDHVEALAALLKLELEEASKRLGRKMALLCWPPLWPSSAICSCGAS